VCHGGSWNFGWGGKKKIVLGSARNLMGRKAKRRKRDRRRKRRLMDGLGRKVAWK